MREKGCSSQNGQKTRKTHSILPASTERRAKRIGNWRVWEGVDGGDFFFQIAFCFKLFFWVKTCHKTTQEVKPNDFVPEIFFSLPDHFTKKLLNDSGRKLLSCYFKIVITFRRFTEGKKYRLNFLFKSHSAL